MNSSAEIAEDLGYIEIPEGLLIHPGEMKNYAPEKVCVLISGTQGEPMSALSRAAVDTHKHAKIEKGDTVVLSSRIIPGNEKSIYRMIDHLFRREAHVIYEDGSSPPIHVSGHGSQEEMRLLVNLVRPKYFIPVHGDYRNLRRHAHLAMETGSVEHAIVLEDGDVLELDKNDARKKDKVTAGRVLIDSGSTNDVVEDLIIRDRRILSEDGIVLAVLAINKHTGNIEQQPEVVMRGFGGADITEQAREQMLSTLNGLNTEQRSDYGMVKEKVRADLKRLIQKKTGRRPMIMPVILEL
jgi:ribonuclease J